LWQFVAGDTRCRESHRLFNPREYEFLHTTPLTSGNTHAADEDFRLAQVVKQKINPVEVSLRGRVPDFAYGPLTLDRRPF
jgi:hypothetical protein